MNMLSLLENFEKGNTIRLFMDDEKQYVVNNAQYKKHDFLRMLSRVEDFKVIYINKITNFSFKAHFYSELFFV